MIDDRQTDRHHSLSSVSLKNPDEYTWSHAYKVFTSCAWKCDLTLTSDTQTGSQRWQES